MNTQVINPTIKFGSGVSAQVHPLAVLELRDGRHIQATQVPTAENGKVVLLGRDFPNGSYKDADSYDVAKLDVVRVIPAIDADKLEKEIEAKLATA